MTDKPLCYLCKKALEVKDLLFLGLWHLCPECYDLLIKDKRRLKGKSGLQH